MTPVDDGMRRAVMRRLALLDQAAERGDAGSLVPLARTELQRLAGGWRLLLEVHTADEDGRCRACPGRWRKRRWPCKVWLLAHQHLIGEGSQQPRRSGGMRNPFRRRGRHSKPTGVAVQGVRTRGLPPDVPPPELLTEITTEIPVLPPAPAPHAIPPPPAIASSGPLVRVPIVDDPTWPTGGVIQDLPAVPALASLDPISAFGGVLPAEPPAARQESKPVPTPAPAPPVVAQRLADRSVPHMQLTEPDAETEEMRRVLEAYWGESPAAT